jgi:peptide/nickel transport system substrate-binding protein
MFLHIDKGDDVATRHKLGTKTGRSRLMSRTAIISTSAVVALALAACGSSSGGGKSSASGGGSLTIGIASEAASLDVQFDGSALQFEPLENVYEALTQYGKTSSDIDADLALTWKELSPTTWQFNLRPNVKFQDGEAFTPDAAVFSIKRALTPSSGTLSDYPLISGATVVQGQNAIVITTSAPDANLPRQVTLLPMLPPNYVTNQVKDFTTSKAVGTGPYKWQSYTKGQDIVLAANPDWWGGKAKYKTVTFKIITDTNVRLQALQAGEIQFATGLDPASAKIAPKLFNLPSNTVCLFQLNTISGPFTDQNVRLAANYAINRPLIVSSLFGTYAKVPNGQLVTALSFGYDPSLTDYPYDVQKAKDLLASSGYKNQPIAVTATTGHWPGDHDMVQAAVGQMRAAGLNIQAKFVDYSVWHAAHVAAPPTYDALLSCTGDDDLDGTKAMVADAGSLGTSAAYKNPAVAAQITAAITTFDTNERQTAMRKVWSTLKDAAIYVPIASVDLLFGGQKNVNWDVPNDGNVLANNITVG